MPIGSQRHGISPKKGQGGRERERETVKRGERGGSEGGREGRDEKTKDHRKHARNNNLTELLMIFRDLKPDRPV